MPRYEYRVLNPTPAAEQSFVEWIDKLDREFMNRDPKHRSDCGARCAASALFGAAVHGARRRVGGAGADAFLRSAQYDRSNPNTTAMWMRRNTRNVSRSSGSG